MGRYTLKVKILYIILFKKNTNQTPLNQLNSFISNKIKYLKWTDSNK
jgi:hypothetical protein